MAFLSPSILSLILAYMLSQFYRAFLAVLTPVLRDELGATPGDLALSSGLWFVAFAVMQPAVGWALDHFGPRRTVALLLALGGGGGAAVFAMASAPWHLHVAMAALGIGCSPALMGPYFIFAREFPPSAFGALAGAMIGIGSLGNILGAAPLVWVIQGLGWRETLWGLAVLTLAVAGAVAILVRDPARLGADSPKGSLAGLLALPALRWMLPLFAVSYAASAAIRGLWAGPYLAEVFGADDTAIGRAALAMGLAMVAGNFAVGPATRLLGGVRRAILIFSAATIVVLAAMAIAPGGSQPIAVALLTLVGFSGASYPLMMAHARAFLPAHLVARGVTFLNMLAIGGVGLMQFASRPLYQWASSGPPERAYSALFLFFLIPLIVGFLLYLKTPEAPANG